MEQLSVCRDFSSTSVGKALQVLEFVGLGGECSLAEIAAHTGAPKSTLMRLLGSLADDGFVVRTGRGRYRVGLKVWRIGCGAVSYDDVRERVLPKVQELVDRARETAHYSVYDAGYSVYVEKVEGSHPIRAYTQVGWRSPAYATATGKALLAWQSDAEIARVAADLTRFTEATLRTPEALVVELADVRSAGVAVNRGEWRAEAWGVAAPVFNHHGEVEAALGVSGPAGRIGAALPALTEAVRDLAMELSVTIEGRQRNRAVA